MDSNDLGTLAGLKYMLAVCLSQIAATTSDRSAFLDQVAKASFLPTVTAHDNDITPETAQERANAVVQAAKACVEETSNLARYLSGAAGAPSEFGLNLVSVEPAQPE